MCSKGLARWLRGKELACQCRKRRKTDWEGPLQKEMAGQYSHLENAMDGGAPQVTVHGAPKESDATEHHGAGHAQQADPATPVPARAGAAP